MQPCMKRSTRSSQLPKCARSLKILITTCEKLENLDYDLRQDVIKVGLARSSFQFTWSFMAVQYGVPEQDWPERQARGGV
jgi:hypothetical protein